MQSITRRNFICNASAGLLGVAGLAATNFPAHAQKLSAQRPNVVLIITDDQGFGDMGCHGNPVLKTPNLDRLHDESVRFSQFNVCPVCSPTRACLMTGRYNYRTGVIDTYAGRSMMDPKEITLAQMLADAGYHTGIFGKWHLGDNYPLRPMDKGFQESLVHFGGGIAQPSDPEFYERENTYFDPVLQHNGHSEKCPGYCSDIFTDAAMEFMDKAAAPFFAYVAYNAPHTPLQVKEEDAAPYKDAGLAEKTAQLYGMIANVDRNVGRILSHLEEKGLAQNTLVIFMTDNGAQNLGDVDRFNAGLRDWKGSVYEGGIHVPCFMRCPTVLDGNREIDRIAAHIDIAPTLLDICGVVSPKPPTFDGVTLVPLLSKTTPEAEWTDRILFFQWHRGDQPEPYKNSAVRNQRWKLVNGSELYDMRNDPAETKNVADPHADTVAALKKAYESWFEDVSATRGYEPVRIHVGSERQNPITLSRQDWRNAENWMGKAVGYWEIFVEREGEYAADVVIEPSNGAGTLYIALGGASVQCAVGESVSKVHVEGLRSQAGNTRLECWVEKGDDRQGVRFITLMNKNL